MKLSELVWKKFHSVSVFICPSSRGEIMPCVEEAKEICGMWTVRNKLLLKVHSHRNIKWSFYNDHYNTALQYSCWLSNYCNSSSVSAFSAFLHHKVMHRGENLQFFVTRQMSPHHQNVTCYSLQVRRGINEAICT